MEDAEVILCKLRTSAHIVDKGLHANKWEKQHGQIAYRDLCVCLNSLQGSALCKDSSYQWAFQIKTEFEKMQQSGMVISSPTESPPSRIGKDELLLLIKSRRSIRSFEQRPIQTKTLTEFADVINWSPTSCNRQPAKLFITQNSEKVSSCLKLCKGATCFGLTPCFIAVCADSRFYPVRDRKLPYIDVSLGMQSMLLYAHSIGIEGTVLNWMHHSSREDKVLRKILGIPDFYIIVAILAIGYSRESIPPPGRKNSKLSFREVR